MSTYNPGGVAPRNLIRVSLNGTKGLAVQMPYKLDLVAKIKTVPGRMWYPQKRYWTVPHTDGAIAHLLAIFAGERVEVDPSLGPISPVGGKPPYEPETPPPVEKVPRRKALDRYPNLAPRSRSLPRASGGHLRAVTPDPKLLDRMREALRSRHYSPRTEQTYCRWIKQFIFFHGMRNPEEMAEPEINAFLTHLAIKGKVSASTQNQALSALLFLYRYVIGRDVGDLENVIRARKPKRVPVVMTRDEVKAVLAQLDGDKWLMASLMYGAGHRVMECLRLRVQDVDFARSEITVRDGKGAKDRITMLPESLKSALNDHLRRTKVIHDKDRA